MYPPKNKLKLLNLLFLLLMITTEDKATTCGQGPFPHCRFLHTRHGIYFSLDSSLQTPPCWNPHLPPLFTCIISLLLGTISPSPSACSSSSFPSGASLNTFPHSSSSFASEFSHSQNFPRHSLRPIIIKF